MANVVIILRWLAHGTMVVAFGLAAVVASPFFTIGIGAGIVASDLSGEWRRARRQTWLWRWARKHLPPGS
jgi:hypothetical protein